MLIGLTGYKGSGKDTVADYLVAEYGFEKHSFAALLKESVCNLFDLRPDQIERWKNDEEVVVAILGPNARLAEGYRTYTFRQFLQRYGTESHRSVFGHDFWVHELFRQIGGKVTSGQNIVITDVRFDNEAHEVCDYGDSAYIVHVTRPGTESDGHVSETPIDMQYVSYTIVNDDDLDYLYQVTDKLMELLKHNG